MENWALAFVTMLEYPSSPLLNRAVCHLSLRQKIIDRKGKIYGPECFNRGSPTKVALAFSFSDCY